MTALCDACGKRPGVAMLTLYGMETWACGVCLGHETEEQPSGWTSSAAFLRTLAQNDYMIDGKYLPAGKMLNQIAHSLDEIQRLTGAMQKSITATIRKIEGEIKQT